MTGVGCKCQHVLAYDSGCVFCVLVVEQPLRRLLLVATIGATRSSNKMSCIAVRHEPQRDGAVTKPVLRTTWSLNAAWQRRGRIRRQPCSHLGCQVMGDDRGWALQPRERGRSLFARTHPRRHAHQFRRGPTAGARHMPSSPCHGP